MENRRWRTLCMVGLTMVFACLLLAGAPHLIAHEQEASGLAPAAMQAVLCSVPAPMPETGDSIHLTSQEQRRMDSACVPMRLRLMASIGLKSDANGNVLGHRSYLHTVYRAFALGDGFA